MSHYPDEIEYSDKYLDGEYEYGHVSLPRKIFKIIPEGRLLEEDDWRSIRVQQSRGWFHYKIHAPEPYILLFRKPHGIDPLTGKLVK